MAIFEARFLGQILFPFVGDVSIHQLFFGEFSIDTQTDAIF